MKNLMLLITIIFAYGFLPINEIEGVSTNANSSITCIDSNEICKPEFDVTYTRQEVLIGGWIPWPVETLSCTEGGNFVCPTVPCANTQVEESN